MVAATETTTGTITEPNFNLLEINADYNADSAAISDIAAINPDFLPNFLDELKTAGNNYGMLFSVLVSAVKAVFGVSGTAPSVAVLLLDKADFKEKMGIEFFESSDFSLEEFNPVITAIINLLTGRPMFAPVFFSREELIPDASYEGDIPNSAIAVPIRTNSADFGYTVIFFHDDTQCYTADSPEIEFITRLVYPAAVVCENKIYEVRFSHYVMNDHLTELPNRAHIYEVIIQLLQMAEVYETRFSLLIIKVKGIKNINDSLGMTTGDMVLKEMGLMIKSAVHDPDIKCARTPVSVGRFSGGDFIVLLSLPEIENCNGCTDDEIVRMYCDAIIEKTKDHIEVNNHKLYLAVNIGASIYPHHGETAEELLRKADLAKSAAKQKGSNSYMIYEHFMSGDAENVLFLSKNFPIAISNKQFELFYQAQQNIKTGKIFAAEALIRWRHPEKGLIPPGAFIPFAESNSYGVQIDKLVLEMACEQMIEWQGKGIDLIISVNVSSEHFANGLICDTVQKVLSAKRIDPKRLKIELLESILVDDFDGTVKVINDLRAMGINVALDDFGSGYSSLEYVAKLPMDYLKVDRAFSMNMEKSSSNKIILEAIMTLAKGMCVKTIAEGVENLEQLKFLESIGCDVAQGYFINRPMDVAAFEDFLAQRNEIAL